MTVGETDQPGPSSRPSGSHLVTVEVPPEPAGRIGWCDAAGDIWSRDPLGLWWPAIDQTGYASPRADGGGRIGLWWPALLAETGPGYVFPLPEPPDTGAIPAVDLDALAAPAEGQRA